MKTNIEHTYTGTRFQIEDFPENTISKCWLHVINNGLGEPIRIPILVARGSAPGPVFGLNAALHGNELNGINVIQRLFARLEATELKGTVIGILVANVPGLLLGQRRFNDGFDLNRQVPGSNEGIPSSVYIFRLLDRVIKKFDYLIDLHTTGDGKENSWHVRADMSDPVTARMARLQSPEIILDNDPDNASLRGYCSKIGIKSLTLELKDSLVFQRDVIEDALTGIRNVLIDLGMIEGQLSCAVTPTILCRKSRWLRSDEGGILTVFPPLLKSVAQGERIAEVRNIFGELQRQFFAPRDGIVVARNTNPICQTGMGILNLGFDSEEIPCLVEMENGSKRL